MPDVGTSTHLVRTDGTSADRRSFRRSCDDRFHSSPGGGGELTSASVARQQGGTDTDRSVPAWSPRPSCFSAPVKRCSGHPFPSPPSCSLRSGKRCCAGPRRPRAARSRCGCRGAPPASQSHAESKPGPEPRTDQDASEPFPGPANLASLEWLAEYFFALCGFIFYYVFSG